MGTATHATNATVPLVNEPTVEENKIAEMILDAAFLMHRELGPGLLESAYEICMCDLLNQKGLKYTKQQLIPVIFQGKKLDAGFRADLIVENKVLVELKSTDKLIPLHDAQVLTYLRLSGIRLGLLLNFNTKLLRDGIKRFVLTEDSLRS